MWVCSGLLAAFAALTGALLVLAHRAEPLLRARILEGLENHFHARVELDSFHLTLRGGLWAEGKGLRIWPPVEIESVNVWGVSAPASEVPLIRLAEFRFHAPLRYEPGQPIRLSAVQLKGLEIDVRHDRALNAARRGPRPLRDKMRTRQTFTRGFCTSR